MPYRLPRCHRVPLLAFFIFLNLGAVLTACGGTAAPSSPSTPVLSARSVPSPTEPALAAPLTGSYAALGASETYGVGAVPHTSGYAYLVAHALRATTFVNRGIPGTTLNAAYQTELTAGLAIRPRLATVFFGFNDLAGSVSRPAFMSELHDFVATLRRARVRVLIIGFPDLALLPSISRRGFSRVEGIVRSWNLGMIRVARQTGSQFLDLRAFSHELANHPRYISPDGLHPSNAGHAALARAILVQIHKDGLWPR